MHNGMDSIKNEFFQQIFEKCSNIKFCYSPFRGSLDVPWVQVDGRTEVQTDVTKLIVTFRNFTKAPGNYNLNKYDTGLVKLNALHFGGGKKSHTSPLGLSKGFICFRSIRDNLRAEYVTEKDF
jgi:hypothetical protein